MTEHAHFPPTKNARQQRIIELLETGQVRSQSELADQLTADGLSVTQATLSRDLVELDAVKVRSPSGALVYAVPGEGGDRTAGRPRVGGERGAPVQAVRRAARLGRLLGQPGRAPHTSGCRELPGLGHGQGRARRRARHHRRRRHRRW